MKNPGNYCISDRPTKSQLVEIEKWLIEERKSTSEGFYCNWNSIKSCFESKNLVVFLSNDFPIGFACLRSNGELTAEISILEIKSNCRNQGLGDYFTKMLLDYLTKKNIYIAELQCAPEESESFWKKLNFLDVPDGVKFFLNKHLYKVLIPSQKPVEICDGSICIEIWDDEPHLTRNKPSKWKWVPDINTQTKKFKLPIIHPCNKDWRIKVIHKGTTIIDDKIKRFGNIEIDFGNFAIIRDIPQMALTQNHY
jgi:hypothetical protein